MAKPSQMGPVGAEATMGRAAALWVDHRTAPGMGSNCPDHS